MLGQMRSHMIHVVFEFMVHFILAQWTVGRHVDPSFERGCATPLPNRLAIASLNAGVQMMACNRSGTVHCTARTAFVAHR